MTEIKDNSLSVILHEMRSPINTVIGLVDLAKQSLDNSEEIEDCLRKIRNLSNYMLSLSNNFLDIFRSENVTFDSSYKDFFLDSVIDEVSSIFEIQTSLKKINFIKKKNDLQDLKLVGNGMQVKQVMINLLSNAVKFTPSEGTIEFDVYALPKGRKALVNFIVKDTGIGMSPEFMKKIYKPYSQDRLIQEKFGGTGLGMTIVKKIVSSYGGKISVDSVKGKGTTFTVTMEFDRLEPSVIDSYNFSGRNILVVDDCEINTEVVYEFLSVTGANIDVAHDGEVAIKKYLSSPDNYYDLILMDMRMPRMNGWEASQYIRNLNRIDAKTIKIIAFSSNCLEEDVKMALDSGMDSCLMKPVDSKILYRTIKAHIGS